MTRARPASIPASIPGLLRPGAGVILSDGRCAVYAGGYRLTDGRWRHVCAWVEDGAAGMPHVDEFRRMEAL